MSQLEISRRLGLVLVAFLIATSIGCRRASFSFKGKLSLNSSFGSSGGVVNKGVETFTSQNAAGKVDVLFVDDNSASMDLEQASLGTRFAALATALAGLDWQVGITTTDCSAGPFGVCGDLLPMVGGTGRVLTPATPNYSTVFRDTIIRPETQNCVARGICPSGNEEALKAAMTAMDKRSGTNAGFFRPNAALAVVILTDEDEFSTGPVGATTPQAVVNRFISDFGNRKTLRGYAITTVTGDPACLATQKAQQGGIGAYGTFSMEFARLTGGVSQSICAPNFATLLNQIGANVQNTVTDAVTLLRVPVAGSVVVKFTPAQNITWMLQADQVVFASPIPAGTVIDVTYDY